VGKMVKTDNVLQTLSREEIKTKIYTIRGMQVMLDEDLALMYGVKIKRLNEQVKRNIKRFPSAFCFQLSAKDMENLRLQNGVLKHEYSLRSQNATLKNKRGKYRKYLPYVFTEQGVSMLSAVLKSQTAIKISIQIMNAFVSMRKFIISNAQVFQRLDTLELKQIQTDQKINNVLTAIENKSIQPKQGIFFDGQIFDAYKFVSELIRGAKSSIVIIDNYIDESVLNLLTKRNKNVKVTILTKNISNQLKLDIEKYNAQYSEIEVKEFKDAHDRFIILDEKDVYVIGASLKDLGKKWFAFSKIDVGALQLIEKINVNL
jgi:hypothetical protein